MLVGIVVGIVALLIPPVGGLGVIAVLGGKAAGLTWNLYTITLAVVVGTIVVGVILYVMSLISVPVDRVLSSIFDLFLCLALSATRQHFCFRRHPPLPGPTALVPPLAEPLA